MTVVCLCDRGLCVCDGGLKTIPALQLHVSCVTVAYLCDGGLSVEVTCLKVVCRM